jgi:hypothetical protein
MTQGFTVPPGPTIVEKLWAELLQQMGKLNSGLSEGRDDFDSSGQRGMCLGLAKALSILLNPYDPDVYEVRREAMRRYRTRRG